MTAVTTTASGIAFGAYDVAIAGGVEHMGRHPMGEGADPNPPSSRRCRTSTCA
jgi:acetyl-CoA acyltransferase